MINKKNRININKFDFFNKKPIKIISTPYFKLIIYKNNILNNRYGILINKKIIKKSTERNKFKRIFFSEFNKFNKINQNQGLDFIIKPQKDVVNITKKELREKINLFLNQNEYLSNFNL